MENTSKLFIFGLNGYIGTHLKIQLNKEYNIFSCTNTLHDKSYKQILKQACINDTCINLSSIIGNDCEIDKRKTKKINIDLNKEICDSKIGKVIFASTSSLYGYQPYPCKESAPLNPTNYYTETKLIAENIVKSSKKFIIIRPGLCFGGYKNISYNNFINSYISNYFKRVKSQIYDIDSYRPYVPVTYVAQVINKLIKSTITNEVFNIGFTHMNYRKFDLIKIFNMLNLNKNIEFIQGKKTRSYQLNCSKLEDLFGLKKKNILEEILKAMRHINYEIKK